MQFCWAFLFAEIQCINGLLSFLILNLEFIWSAPWRNHGIEDAVKTNVEAFSLGRRWASFFLSLPFLLCMCLDKWSRQIEITLLPLSSWKFCSSSSLSVLVREWFFYGAEENHLGRFFCFVFVLETNFFVRQASQRIGSFEFCYEKRSFIASLPLWAAACFRLTSMSFLYQFSAVGER